MSDRHAMLALSGELFASRGLALLWLPVGVFASPSLHAVPGVPLPVWFWRVDAPFGGVAASPDRAGGREEHPRPGRRDVSLVAGFVIEWLVYGERP